MHTSYTVMGQIVQGGCNFKQSMSLNPKEVNVGFTDITVSRFGTAPLRSGKAGRALGLTLMKMFANFPSTILDRY